MADGGENNNFFKNNSRPSNDDDNSEDENVHGPSSGPDIGLGNNSRQARKTTETGQAGSSMSAEGPRREENPFSFKHFLNQAMPGGARPKVYSTKSSVSPRIVANPELASGLPDFVQDHLVIEQCFLNQASQSESCPIVDVDLAEFDVDGSNERWNNGRTGDLPFDLTESRHEHSNEPSRVPLDLPQRLRFDLPSNPPSGEVASTSLPDFLSDGPIHSGRRTDGGQPPSEPSSPVVSPHPHHPLMQSLQSENERLRRIQETLRRQMTDQVRRNESLEAELRVLRSRDHDDTASLDNAVQQVEKNLAHALKRAETAELKVTKLKQEKKLLLKMDRDSRGACGPSGTDRVSDQRLSSELRAAVTGAEHSLRQMLSGIDTLRMIASTLENRHRIEDQPDFSELEPEHGDDSGPAL